MAYPGVSLGSLRIVMLSRSSMPLDSGVSGLCLWGRLGGCRTPPLGTPGDGRPCPTTRDFFVVDQDQSDNVLTQYKLINGKIAQSTQANQADGTIKNASDNGLLNRNILPTFGCVSATAPDITTGGTPSPSLALNELSAVQQGEPAALIPRNNPMTMVGNNISPVKTGLYRLGVNQPLVGGQTPKKYCQLLQQIFPPRQLQNDALLTNAPSPDPALNLKQFLQNRYEASLVELGCSERGRDRPRRDDRFDG